MKKIMSGLIAIIMAMTCFLSNVSALDLDIPTTPIALDETITITDLENEDGIIGKGGTSRKHAELLARYFVKYANENSGFNINCKVLSKEQVNLKDMKKTTDNKGVIIARCYQDVEHYVIITKIDDSFAYIFDPYYLEEGYYYDDEEVAIVLHETFTHNRLVKLERLFDESNKDFSLLKKQDREVILINKY